MLVVSPGAKQTHGSERPAWMPNSVINQAISKLWESQTSEWQMQLWDMARLVVFLAHLILTCAALFSRRRWLHYISSEENLLPDITQIRVESTWHSSKCQIKSTTLIIHAAVSYCSILNTQLFNCSQNCLRTRKMLGRHCSEWRLFGAQDMERAQKFPSLLPQRLTFPQKRGQQGPGASSPEEEINKVQEKAWQEFRECTVTQENYLWLMK